MFLINDLTGAERYHFFSSSSYAEDGYLPANHLTRLARVSQSPVAEKYINQLIANQSKLQSQMASLHRFRTKS